MQCRDFARQLAAASPEFEARNTRLLIIGPGSKNDAERMAKATKAKPSEALFDEAGSAYDAYMLDKVFFSLLQRSAAFIVDKEGVIRYGVVVTNALNWLRSASFQDLLKALETLESPS